MRRRPYLIYPALAATVPIVYRQAKNLGVTPSGDALVFSLVTAAAFAALQLAFYALLRAARRGPADTAADRAALLTLACVVAHYAVPPAWDWARATVTNSPHRAATAAAFAAGLLALAALGVALRRVARRAAARRAATAAGAERPATALASFGRFMATMAALLVAWSTAQIVAAPWRRDRILHGSAAWAALQRPVAVVGGPTPGAGRDVYLFILDAYPAAEQLRKVYSIDNQAFEDSLRALGFRLPAGLRSNYGFTFQSLSSFLNFAQTAPIYRDAPSGYRDYGLAAQLIEHNRAERFLRARGYQFVFFPSEWFGPTRHNRDADREVHPPNEGGVMRRLARLSERSLLVGGLVQETMWRAVRRYGPTGQDVIVGDAKQTFAGVAALAKRPAGGPPVFALVHMLMPHPGFYADSACRPLPRGTHFENDSPAKSPAVRAQIAGYVACENQLVLATVRDILARPGPRPIILLQGDHGLSGLDLFLTPRDSITPDQVTERYSPLGAYYLPDGGAAAVPDSTSLANVLGGVFRHYYGAQLPQVPNEMYLSELYSYRMTPIDTLRLRVADAPAGGAPPAAPARLRASR